MTRKEAIDKISDCWNKLWGAYCELMTEDSLVTVMGLPDELRAAIRALEQPATYQNLTKPNNELKGWIPCSERLPEMHTDVLTCDTYGGIWICSLIFTGRNNEACWEDDYGYLHNFDERIAWRPLPEPYNPESEESE